MIVPVGMDAALGAGAGQGLSQLPLMQVMPTMRDDAAAAQSTDTTGFEGMLTRAVGGLSNTLGTSARLSELAATGELSDPTQAILAAEEADLAMQMATQVRNRLLESWREISQMSI